MYPTHLKMFTFDPNNVEYIGNSEIQWREWYNETIWSGNQLIFSPLFGKGLKLKPKRQKKRLWLCKKKKHTHTHFFSICAISALENLWLSWRRVYWNYFQKSWLCILFWVTASNMAKTRRYISLEFGKIVFSKLCHNCITNCGHNSFGWEFKGLQRPCK